MSDPNPPPIQNPYESCPSCGAYLPQSQGYCANCGYGRQATAGSATLQVIAILLLVFIGLPAACLGACFLSAGGSARADSGALSFVLMGLLGVGIFVGMIALVVFAFRRKK